MALANLQGSKVIQSKPGVTTANVVPASSIQGSPQKTANIIKWVAAPGSGVATPSKPNIIATNQPILGLAGQGTAGNSPRQTYIFSYKPATTMAGRPQAPQYVVVTQASAIRSIQGMTTSNLSGGQTITLPTSSASGNPAQGMKMIVMPSSSGAGTAGQSAKIITPGGMQTTSAQKTVTLVTSKSTQYITSTGQIVTLPSGLLQAGGPQQISIGGKQVTLQMATGQKLAILSNSSSQLIQSAGQGDGEPGKTKFVMVGAGQKPNIPTTMSQMRLSGGGVIQVEVTSTSSMDGIGAATKWLVEMAEGAETQRVSADQNNLNGMNPDGDGGLKGGRVYGPWSEFSFSGLPWMKFKAGGLEQFDYGVGMRNQTTPIYNLSTKFSWTAALNIGLKGGDEGDGMIGGQAVTSSDNQQQATEDPTQLAAPVEQQFSNNSFASVETASDAVVAGQVQADVEQKLGLSTLQPRPNTTTSGTSGSTITLVTGCYIVLITQATPAVGFPENVPAQDTIQPAPGQQTQSDLSMEPLAPKTERGQSSVTMTFSQPSLGIASATTTFKAPQFLQSNPIAVTAASSLAPSTTIGHVQQNLLQVQAPVQAASLLNTLKLEHPLSIQSPNLISSSTTVPVQAPQSAVGLPSRTGKIGAQPQIIMQPLMTNQSPSGIPVSISNQLMLPTGVPVSIPAQETTLIKNSYSTVAGSGTTSQTQSVGARMPMPTTSPVVRPQMPEMRFNNSSQPGTSLLSAAQSVELSGLHILAAAAAGAEKILIHRQVMKVVTQVPGQLPLFLQAKAAKSSGVLPGTVCFGSPVSSLLKEATPTVETTRISSIKKYLLRKKSGIPGTPSSVRISKSADGATIAWEPPLNTPGDNLEYSVYLAVKLPANAPEPKPGVTNLSFVRVYCGPSNQCNVPTASLNQALVDTTSMPAIILRIAAKNDKGYGRVIQVRWLQESAVPNFSTPKTGILKRPATMPPTVQRKRDRT
ncbi:unnamed protein product [Orchesella dallaii]|uniref:Fibronectin type-III domain-containing protein n=1 Tax=Orchesella dallaii TaxID=48710 RepID=A0ABP1R577_9HEXA